MLRNTAIEEELPPQSVDELRRKVAWQVSIAYGLPLEEAREWEVTPPLSALKPEPAPAPVAPTPLPAPLPQPQPEPELPPAAAGPFVLPKLTELERLVAAADASPARVEEWRWYLFYLRDFAEADGTLDDTFSLLVETAFGELLETQPSVH